MGSPCSIWRVATAPSSADVATAYIGRKLICSDRGSGITRDKDVLDFGCGPGGEAVEIAERGAARHRHRRAPAVARPRRRARGRARRRRSLRSRTNERSRRSDRLARFVRALRRSGRRARTDAPPAPARRQGAGGLRATWYHPLGGHIYSVFPFSHLLFSERALVQWQALHKSDGATTIAESGLNKMTIRRFISWSRRARCGSSASSCCRSVRCG